MGLMAYLDPKGEGDNSVPGKQRPIPGVGMARCGTGAIWRKLDCLNPNPQLIQSTVSRKTPETDSEPLRRYGDVTGATFGAQNDHQ